jgi:hypothetical protein
MPRATKQPVVYIALSPAAVATALGLRPEIVREAIDAALLPVYRKGIKSRCLVSDVEAWVRSWPKPAKRQYKKRSPNG